MLTTFFAVMSVPLASFAQGSILAATVYMSAKGIDIPWARD